MKDKNKAMKIRYYMRLASAFALIRIFGRKIPLFVSWQITRRCNLKCLYCGYPASSGAEEITTDDAIRIVEDLAKAGTVGISFTGGEPLLRNDLGKIITYARSRNISSKINTNGEFIPQKIDEIKDVNQVNISFDGPEQVHDHIRGEGSYRAVLRGVEALKKAKKKIVFHVTLTKYNISSLDFVLDTCRSYGIGAFFQPATELFSLGTDIKPHYSDKINYIQAIHLLIQEKQKKKKYIYNSISGLKHLLQWPGQAHIYCSAGRAVFRINPEGYFYHCDRFPNPRKISFFKNGVRSILNNMLPLSCNECWCGPLVELNLAMGCKLDAALNALKAF